MDIVRFKGGLGNQMFQYAFYQALKNKGRETKVNLGYYKKNPRGMRFCLDRVFPDVKMEHVSDEEFEAADSRWHKIKSDPEILRKFLYDHENRFFWVDDENGYQSGVFSTRNCTYVGYWQSEKYFKSISQKLSQHFRFAYGERKLEDIKNQFLSSDCYAAIHIRRGDYLTDTALWGNLAASTYYQDAFRLLESQVGTFRPVFFSDDIHWVKENYTYKEAIYIESTMFDQYEYWYDMCLMSCCAHNIIANSSFSWWGAWLNSNKSKIVIAPAKWFYDGRKQEDICPVEWQRLDVREDKNG